MDSFAALFTGILIAVMVAFNGALSARYGVYSSTALIHLAGFALISALCLFKREKLFTRAYRRSCISAARWACC